MASSTTVEIPTEALATRQSLSAESWLKRVVGAPDDARIERLVVFAGPSRRKMSRVVGLRVGPDSKWEQLASDIESAVRASGQKFARVDAFRGAERVPEFTRSWEVPFDAPDDDEGSEPDELVHSRDGGVAAAHAGLLRQAHAHVDRYMQLFQGLTAETLQHYRETTVALRNELADTRREMVELQRLASTREDERAARDVQVAREKAIADAASSLVSAVAVRIGGQKNASEELVKLLDSLAPEQQERLVQMLSPEQQILLSTIFQTAKKA
jgi:hypothetical protein